MIEYINGLDMSVYVYDCDGIVGGTHPTDYGLASMAKAVGDVLEIIFAKM